MKKINQFFEFSERKTSFRVELIAGLTTFMTMAYVLVVQPSAIVGFGPAGSIVDINGLVISKEALLIVCALISALITFLMAVYTNLPFALSTGMGANFMLGTLIQTQQISFGHAMAITLLAGILFLVLSLFGVRDLIVRMIPKNIKVSIGVAIGFFIAYLGFKNTGIGQFTNGISMGDFSEPRVYLAIAGLLIIAVLTAYKVKGAILIGIILTTIIGIPLGVTPLPTGFFKIPVANDVSSVIFAFDFSQIISPASFVLMFIVFFGDFFSTLGTVLGVAKKADMLDDQGNLPGIQKPFLVDAIGTVVGACTGNTTITTYVESSAGVEAGGRTGVTSLVVGFLFIISMFFAPLVLMIPNAATGPALIFVGLLMIKGIKDIDFDDFTEAFGPFIMLMFCTFLGSIAAGIAAGIIAYITLKVLTGRAKELHPGMFVLYIPLLLYFIYNKPLN
jgi:adenine/guanine/hypoxanthine permease